MVVSEVNDPTVGVGDVPALVDDIVSENYSRA